MTDVPTPNVSFFQLTYDEVESWLLERDVNVSAASRLYNDYYKQGKPTPRWHKIAKHTRFLLEQAFSFSLPQPEHIHEASDKTVKFLFQLEDGETVEAVLIPFQGKYTLCLSSQVGCAMKCGFCHTGTQGLTRNLRASEIVGQFVVALQWMNLHRPNEARILNVVFMGQGEPLHNFDEVKRACEIFLTRQGACLADHKITISTCGYMPGLRRWNNEMPNVNIALSLHSPDDERRSALIPVNNAYPLAEVLSYIDTIPMGRKRFVTFAYLLLADFNDRDEDAIAIGELLKDRPSILNIIPFNPYPGAQYQRPNGDRIERFAAKISPFGFPVLVRTAKGDDILAACGQLKSAHTDES